jgi:hypothetical protein
MDQRDVFVALGVNAARDTRGRVGYAVDYREGGHWIELALLATRDDAQAAIDRAVGKGASPAYLRVRRVHDDG